MRLGRRRNPGAVVIRISWADVRNALFRCGQRNSNPSHDLCAYNSLRRPFARRTRDVLGMLHVFNNNQTRSTSLSATFMKLMLIFDLVSIYYITRSPVLYSYMSVRLAGTITDLKYIPLMAGCRRCRVHPFNAPDRHGLVVVMFFFTPD